MVFNATFNNISVISIYIQIHFHDKKILFHDNNNFNFTTQNMKKKLFGSLNVTLLMLYYKFFNLFFIPAAVVVVIVW